MHARMHGVGVHARRASVGQDYALCEYLRSMKKRKHLDGNDLCASARLHYYAGSMLIPTIMRAPIYYGLFVHTTPSYCLISR